jgi:hypothetical protein
MKTVNVKGTLIVPRVEKPGTDKKATFLLLLLKKVFSSYRSATPVRKNKNSRIMLLKNSAT